MKAGFPGFPQEALSFLRQLERNNHRDWFQPRKDLFEEKVRRPMLELVNALDQQMARFAPDHIVEPEKAIYRIYRDTRFSQDKTPYKTHIAAIFPKRGMAKHTGASFYFSVSHKEVEVAGGVYMPPPENVLAVRAHIAENHQEFRRILGSKRLKALMGELQGEQLSKVPKGFSPEHPAADLIRYKQWVFYVLLKPELATTPGFLAEITERFRVMKPLADFLNTPLAKKQVGIRAEELIG
jgi:uncharacterized protein (TIGR02453 family)